MLAQNGAQYLLAFKYLSEPKGPGPAGALWVWGIALGAIAVCFVNIGLVNQVDPDGQGRRAIRFWLTVGLSVCLVFRLSFARWLTGLFAGIAGVVGAFAIVTMMRAGKPLHFYNYFAVFMTLSYFIFSYLLLFNLSVDRYFNPQGK